MAYEHESICKLHTIYNYPGRFGTKVVVFTNSKTTSQICVSSNRIISGLDDEKKSYGLRHNLQDGMLQPNQSQILYAFLTSMAMLALFLLMARVTLTLTLILHLNLEFDFLVQPLPKSIRNVTFAAIQPMALMRATLTTSPSGILLSHSFKINTKALCRND